MRALRAQMRSLGFGHREIATEFARRYGLRPRSAWREALGWSLKEAAERINAYAGLTGLDSAATAAMTGPHLCEAEAWPGPGEQPTGRRPSPYLLSLLAAVYGCTVSELADIHDRRHMPPGEMLILEKYSQSPPVTVSHPARPEPGLQASDNPDLPPVSPMPAQEQAEAHHVVSAAASAGLLASSGVTRPPGITYCWIRGPEPPGSRIEREVVMTSHESREHAERAERREVGDATLEQLRADVVRLSAESMTGDPFPMFEEMRRVRNRIYGTLDRQVWPRDATDLYFLCGVINCLMAVAADDLGYPQAAEELVRAGWAYATAVDHRPLMAHLRLELAGIGFWPRPRQSRDLAASGLRYLADGPNAAQLHLQFGRAAARLGDADAARQAIAAASEARERPHNDDLLEIGGEFGFSRATQNYMAGAAAIEIPGAEADAASALQTAIELYAAGPEPGEHHGYGSRALAHVDLTTARLRAGDLDAAAAAIGPVLALPPAKRILALSQRLARTRHEMASPLYQGSQLAGSLDEQIEEFIRDTIASSLHDLPASAC